MFYSTQILAKKGPLGTVWIAAHLDRRLKRSQVFEANISSSVDSIINPEAPLALRLTGQLLLGVVKIYSRKVGYLYSDCNEAVARIAATMTSRGGASGAEGGGDGGDVDLPEDEGDAVVASITLPEGTTGENVAEVVAALNSAGGGVGGRFFLGNNSSALDAFAASIELGGAGNISWTGDSFLIAEEVSTLLPSSALPGGGNDAFDPTAGVGGPARFALSGRDIERALSGSAGAPFADVDGDVETLRDASALPDRLPPASGLFGDDGAGGGGAAATATTKMTAGMEPPPDYYDDDDGGGGGFGGGYEDDDDGLDTPGDGLPPTPGDGAGASPALVGTAALVAAANGGVAPRRKRPRVDVDEATERPKTQLGNLDIRKLLEDPSSLMRGGGDGGSTVLATYASSASLGAAVSDLLVANAAAARAKRERSSSDRARSLLARPAFAPFMAPELYDVVVRCAPPPVAAPPRKRGGAAAAAAAAGEEGAPDAAAFGGDYDDGGAGAFDGGWGAADGGFAADDDDEDFVGGGGFGGIAGDDRDRSADGGDEDGENNDPSSSAHSAAITRRTRAALDRLQGEWGSDARRVGPSAARPASLEAVTRGSNRLDAARWFFEVLVLRSRGFVDVEQRESYGDVVVRPRAMAFDESVLGALNVVASTPVAAV